MTESEFDQIEREFTMLADGHPEYRHTLIVRDEFGQEWTIEKRPGEAMLRTSCLFEGLEEEEWP